MSDLLRFDNPNWKNMCTTVTFGADTKVALTFKDGVLDVRYFGEVTDAAKVFFEVALKPHVDNYIANRGT